MHTPCLTHGTGPGKWNRQCFTGNVPKAAFRAILRLRRGTPLGLPGLRLVDFRSLESKKLEPFEINVLQGGVVTPAVSLPCDKKRVILSHDFSLACQNSCQYDLSTFWTELALPYDKSSSSAAPPAPVFVGPDRARCA